MSLSRGILTLVAGIVGEIRLVVNGDPSLGDYTTMDTLLSSWVKNYAG